MCMQLWHCGKPKFLSQMNSDFHQTWYDHQGGIKDARNNIGSDSYMQAHKMHMNMYTCSHNVRKHAQTVKQCA